MKGLFFTMATLFVMLIPAAESHAEEMPYHIDGLGQFRLSEDLIERLLAVKADVESGDFSGPDEETFKSPDDIVAAMDSSPEFSAILSKHGLTSKDTLLFMMTLYRAMNDAEEQPTIDVTMSETAAGLMSARQANRVFYIQHKTEIDTSFPPPGEDEDEEAPPVVH